MFERFTKDARAVVRGAVERAVRSGVAAVEPGHVLLALLDRADGRAFFALTALGAWDHRESIERAVDAAHRRAGLSRADEDALAELGIDLTEIVSRVEEAHGAGALAGEGAGRRGRKEKGRLTGHRPLTPDAKEILITALRMATGHRDRRIGGEHLLLALLVRPGIPADVLAEYGVTYASAERMVHCDGADGQGGENRNLAS